MGILTVIGSGTEILNAVIYLNVFDKLIAYLFSKECFMSALKLVQVMKFCLEYLDKYIAGMGHANW